MTIPLVRVKNAIMLIRERVYLLSFKRDLLSLVHGLSANTRQMTIILVSSLKRETQRDYLNLENVFFLFCVLASMRCNYHIYDGFLRIRGGFYSLYTAGGDYLFGKFQSRKTRR